MGRHSQVDPADRFTNQGSRGGWLPVIANPEHSRHFTEDRRNIQMKMILMCSILNRRPRCGSIQCRPSE
jgi:hypothetical protein